MESLRYKYRRPTHPGKLIREEILPVLRIALPKMARQLGVSQQLLTELINERVPVTADLAIKLSRVMGRNPASWLKMQQAVDLWDLECGAANKPVVRRPSNGTRRKAS